MTAVADAGDEVESEFCGYPLEDSEDYYTTDDSGLKIKNRDRTFSTKLAR